MDLRKLKERSLQRADRRFLRKVLTFAVSTAIKHGKELPRLPDDFPFRKVLSLQDFGGFTFYIDIKQSALGGNEVTAWYHPSPGEKPDSPPVLKIRWQTSIKECVVVRRDPGLEWQLELLNVIRHRRGIGYKIERELRRAEKRQLRERKRKEDARARLIDEFARKLALIEGRPVP